MLRPSSRAIALCVALLAFALSTQAAGAATIAVTTEADENGTNTNACSLREAVRSANGNTSVGGCTQGDGADTITVPAGLYLLTVTSGTASGDLDLTTNITINGAGQAQTVIDGTSLNDRVFDVSDANANVTITGLTIQHGTRGRQRRWHPQPGHAHPPRRARLREHRRRRWRGRLQRRRPIAHAGPDQHPRQHRRGRTAAASSTTRAAPSR